MDDVTRQIARADRSMSSGAYVHNAWYVACWNDELAAGTLLARKFLNQPVVLYRASDGSVVALQDRCPHRFAPLSPGKLTDGDRVQCPYHGLEFDRSGMCVHNPHGTGNIPSRAKVRSYPTIIKHHAVWIWMGEAAPDYDAVPDFSVLDGVPAAHETKRDRIIINANYELIVDNLLDLSHVPYLHDGLLGNKDTINPEITVEQDGEDVVVGRIAKDAAPPGVFTRLMPDIPSRVDQFSIIRWTSASNLRLYTGVCKPGDKLENGTGFHAIHLLTPETDRTTHYFFTAARFNVMTRGAETNAEISDTIAKMRRYAFQEQDAPMIEAQQRVIDDALDDLDPVVLSVDVGPMRYRRILQKKIDAELQHQSGRG
jgi:phenylpropionate dioxygenase-like ring-hydroxylating dioxygenase large terminal subunit